MAHDNTFIPFITPNVGAAYDMRQFMHKVVNIGANGVRLTVADVGSGAQYVLANKPNSGDHVSLNKAPNVTKAVAGAAVVQGNAIVAANSGFCVAGTSGVQSALFLGYALTGCASGSVFDLDLRA